MDYGIKVVKEGKNINTSDIRDILMSSKYSMLKYHQDSIDSVTINPGDTGCHVDFTHGLGYTPAFISYYEGFDGKQKFIPAVPRGIDFNIYSYSYADATKIRCGIEITGDPYNQPLVYPGDDDYWGAFYSSIGYIVLGNTGDVENGAIRFPNVAVDKNATIVDANIFFYIEYKGVGEGSLKYKVFGIDEDNTDVFNDPMGRPQTTASYSAQTALTPVGTWFGINVKSIVEEITTRAGWVNGNAMGFLLYDDGSPEHVYAQDDGDYAPPNRSYLKITYGSSTSLKFRSIIFKDKIV